MRMILVGLSAALLAGCGGAAVSNNSSGNAAGNAAAPAAPAMPGNMVLPGGEGDAGGAGNSAAAGGSRNSREALLADCTQEATAGLAPGTDVAGLCSCAVDRHLGGATQSDAMRQCATEQNVQLPMGR